MAYEVPIAGRFHIQRNMNSMSPQALKNLASPPSQTRSPDVLKHVLPTNTNHILFCKVSLEKEHSIPPRQISVAQTQFLQALIFSDPSPAPYF